ncbi:formate--tetrahydrofolate ligase [bacterium]|nr:formate--tetrahydrofolate ligase [bacterium]
MPSDIEIAQTARMLPITDIGAKLGIEPDELELYGKYKAKITDAVWERVKNRPNGKLILVTAMTATPAGEGKTVTSIGLAQAFGRMGVSHCLALREPSLGPTFGIKGGAAGGGFAQVLPMEDINLHFTGDIHAVGAANNLLAALVDNHIQQGNALQLDPRRITWRRAIDISDRQLRFIVAGLGGRPNGFPRESGFDITVASEVMAVVALASDMADLKERLGRMMIGRTWDGKPVFAGQLNVVGSLAVLLKDAMKPNLVQTLENTPAIIHCGPFANIAHGCNSVRATRLALKLADYTITEAGFAADLGAEKFFDIKCRQAGFTPSAAVVVASCRALKMHGGVPKTEISQPNPDMVLAGCANLRVHLENIRKFGVPQVVAINRFPTDTDEEVAQVKCFCADMGVEAVESTVCARGGEGGIELARAVMRAADQPNGFKFLYDENLPIKKKVEKIAVEIYRARGVEWTNLAERHIRQLEADGLGNVPVCMAKTQLSLSDTPGLLGAPTDWRLEVNDVRISRGAGFLVVICGDIMLMPGLPKVPAAEKIDILEDGTIVGLF